MSGWSHRTSAILAADGFLCYPHSYSKGGNGWNAGHIENVEIRQTIEALSALRDFEPCNGKVAVYGVSRGAEHALLLAALMSEVGMQDQPDAVACLAAPDVVCGAFDARSFRDSGDPGWQAWDPSRRAWTWNGSSENLLPTTPIDVTTYQGPLFLSVGLKDRTWSPDMTKRLQQRREAEGLPVEAHFYEDEGHIPGSDGENRHHELLLSFLERAIGR
ncbi:MAG: acyl-CoA thioester hydrolase/BAAT C-terminal domain-containing protein [Pseudomonadota bacterium]